MKKCVRCCALLDEEQFNRNSSKPDGLQNYCRTCQRAYDRDHYKINPNRKYAVRRNDTYQLEILQRYVWDYLSSNPCVDCGETDPVVLDFDHINSAKKSRNVAELVKRRGSLARLIAEIDKCLVRCANCHRRKTAAQLGYWKSAYAGELLV